MTLTRSTHKPTFLVSVAWSKVSEGKTCDVDSVNKGKLSSVSLCSEECRFQATMFSYSVPDSPECDDSGCACKCMSGASKEATCARVDSVHDHLYAFRGRNVYHVKYCLNIIPSYFPATRINVYLKVSSVGWVLARFFTDFCIFCKCEWKTNLLFYQLFCIVFIHTSNYFEDGNYLVDMKVKSLNKIWYC